MTKRWIVLLALAVVALAVAPPIYAQSWVRLSNGIVGDGELEVNTDTYGAVTVWNWADNYDWWDPMGLPDPRTRISFANSLFVYNQATQDRVTLAEKTKNIDVVYNQRAAGGATFSYAIVTGLSAFDTDNDGIDDSATSSFSVTGGNAGVDLQIDLAQNVAKPVGGVSVWTKTYTITNNSGAPADIQVAYHCDLDLLFDRRATDAAGVAETGGVLNPYMQEADNVPNFENTKIALSGTPGYDYVAGRTGFDPDGPACGTEICGDASCDGVFNGGDIDAFFVALGDPILWASQHPTCDIVCVADINGSGAVNGGDIDPFFAALGGMGPCDAVGGPDPAMGVGTDFQQWDNFGMPESWKNYAAGVGYNTVGIDPSRAPVGGRSPNDGFMTLQWNVSLAAGASTDILVVLSYGSATP